MLFCPPWLLTSHILSSPSFNSLQAVVDCVKKDTVDSDPGSCMNVCFKEADVDEEADESTPCQRGCLLLDACYTNCFTGDTCKAEIYAMTNCHIDSELGPGVCSCGAASEADAPAIKSFALNLAHALKKNLRNSRAEDY